jgi:tetratricopeptide (TPR) repeat protein
MRRLIIIFFSIIYCFVSDGAKASEFKEALDAYKAKQYQKSKDILEGVVRENGDDIPVRLKLLLGANYFYLRDVKRAQRVFTKLKGEMPDTHTAFAWGVSFYKKKERKLALKGLKKVSKENPVEYAYASYYLGVIHLGMNNAPAAKFFLNRSDPAFLSNNFRRNRRALLKRVTKMISRPFQGLDNSLNSDSLALSLISQNNAINEAKNNKKIDKQASTVTVLPIIVLSQKTIDSTNHNLAKSAFTNSNTRGQLLVKIEKMENQNLNYKLDLGLGVVQYNVKENIETLFNISGAEGDFLDQKVTAEGGNDFLSFGLLGADYAFNSRFSVVIELTAQQLMTDFVYKKGLGFLGGRASAVYELDDLEFEMVPTMNYVVNNTEEISSIEFTNKFNVSWNHRFFLLNGFINGFYTDKPYVSRSPYRFQSLNSWVNQPDGSWQSFHSGVKSDVPFLGGGLFLGADVTEKFYTQGFAPMRLYNSEPLEKSASTILNFNLGYRFNIFNGVSAQIDGRYAFLSDYSVSIAKENDVNQDQLERLSSDVAIMGGSLGFVVNPYDWLFLTAHYGYYIHDYMAISDNSRIEELQGYNPDSSVEIKAMLGLEKSF